MTGFGACEITFEKVKGVVEIKTVNHRYLELSIRLPELLMPFEMAFRDCLRQHIARGKQVRLPIDILPFCEIPIIIKT